MSLYLYGLIRQPEAVDFGHIGFDKAAVRTIPCGPFAVVVGQPPSENFKNIPREALVKILLSHQATLETIMERFFVLPLKFGTVVKDENELLKIVHEGKGFLSELFEKVKDSVEIDVVATWDVRTILQEIGEEDPEVTACKEEMAKGDTDRVHIGMLLAQALKRRADDWRRKIKEGLKNVASASADHDLLNDTMVLNSSFLIRKGEEAKFYHAVDELNLHFKGKLNFKCVGPLPPYSFATITLQRFDLDEVQQSALILGLNGTAELGQVKKVYKELSRKCHPDTSSNLSVEKFEELNRAYELVADYCKDGAKSLEREAVEQCVRLAVMENPHVA